jgi:hypothetical protein
MRKTLTAIAAAATLTLAIVAAPQQAEARHGRNAAIIGGLALGALAGAAIANGGYYYAPGPAYYYAPGPGYYYGPRCYWTHQRYWSGRHWHSRRVRVCD